METVEESYSSNSEVTPKVLNGLLHFFFLSWLPQPLSPCFGLGSLFLLNMQRFRILHFFLSPETDCSSNTADVAHGHMEPVSVEAGLSDTSAYDDLLFSINIHVYYLFIFLQHLNFVGFFSLWVFDISSHPAPLTTVCKLHLSSKQALRTALLIHVLSDNCTLGTLPQPCAQDQGCVCFSSPSHLPFSLLPCWFFCFFHHKHPVTCSLLKWIWQPRGTSQLGWKECFWPSVGSLNVFLHFSLMVHRCSRSYTKKKSQSVFIVCYLSQIISHQYSNQDLQEHYW